MKNNIPTENRKYEFYESKWLSILWFIFILVAGGGLSIPFLLGVLSDESVRFLVFIPIFMIIVWLYMCYHYLYSILRPKAYLIIDSQKIQCNGGCLDTRKIERVFFWNEIESVSLEFCHAKQSIPSLKLKMKNDEEWIHFTAISDDDRRSILKIIQRYKRILYKNTDSGNSAYYSGWLLVILLVNFVSVIVALTLK